MKVCCGRRSRAWRSMSADVSMPITSAFGQRLTKSSVELPGPQPMSMTLCASVSGIWASRSRGGRVRSSSNLRYCSALQSAISCRRSYRMIRKKPAPHRMQGVTRPSGQIMRKSSSRQLLILHPVGDNRVLSEPTHLVLFIILEVALEPFDMAVALEGQDMGRNTVEEPAIVADDDGPTGKILQR